MKTLAIEISENYSRLDDDNSFPGICIDNDGSAFIGMNSKSGTPGSVWHGMAEIINTKGLTASKVAELYEEAGEITWKTKWNGSNHVGCILSVEMQERLLNLEREILDAQHVIEYWGIEDCDWKTILEEQTVIRDWSELTEENMEEVAAQILTGLYSYEEDYSVCCVELRDIIAQLEDEIIN